MKIQGTEEEIEFIKNTFAITPCEDCVYYECCDKQPLLGCDDVVNSRIEFELIK